MKILSTLLAPDVGTVRVLGHDLRREAGAIRGAIGVTGQFSAVDTLLTGEENLLLMGRLLHLPPAERRARGARLLERFDLTDAESPVALAFQWEGLATYRRLQAFCTGVADAMQASTGRGRPAASGTGWGA